MKTPKHGTNIFSYGRAIILLQAIKPAVISKETDAAIS